MSDLIGLVFGIFAILAVSLFLLFAPFYAVNYYDCKGYSEITGRPTKFKLGTCYGQIDGVWYSSDEYNKIFVAERKQLELKAAK